MIASNFPPNSKVWIYFSKRDITTEEQTYIAEKLNTFIGAWQYHGAGVEGGFEIIDQRFIVLIANEDTNVGGCSIDSSVQLFRDIDAKYNLGLLDRTTVAYTSNGTIKQTAFNKVKPLIESGEITKDAIVFNNSVATLQDFNTNWKQSAENSWVSRFF